MKFKGEPNLVVSLHSQFVKRMTHIRGFQFDDNGEYETENPMLIKILSQHHKIVDEVIEKENNAIDEEVKGDKIKEIQKTIKQKSPTKRKSTTKRKPRK